jgi:outer membrane protein OmpA-like peptidoglycan-associated protein
VLLALAACNPIETYRNWIGVSANDPNPKTTPNTGNLAAADARSYPNLATVPPPPSQALTMAELDKLTQNLIADRTHAKYTSEHLQASFDEAAAPPPPPPPPAPPPANTASPAAPAAPAPPATAEPASPPAAGKGAVGPVAAAETGGKTPRKAGEPPESEPIESTLKSPQIAALPQPEQARPAPAPAPELGTAQTVTRAGTAPGAHLPPPPAPPPMPAAIGSAQFQSAPPPPKLAAIEPTRATAAGQPGKPAKLAAVPLAYAKIADIAFAGNAATLTDADRQALAGVVARFRTKPGAVRVVGYAGIDNSAAEQLNSYRIALDRAQAVADDLKKAGIPGDKIQVEAAPAGTDSGHGRAEILFGQ